MSDGDGGEQPRCLICSAGVSAERSYGIYYTAAPHSGTLLATLVQRVLRRGGEQAALPGTSMCGGCFALFEQLDYSQEKCLKLREDISACFREGCRKSGFRPEEVNGAARQAAERQAKEASGESDESDDPEEPETSQDAVTDDGGKEDDSSQDEKTLSELSESQRRTSKQSKESANSKPGAVKLKEEDNNGGHDTTSRDVRRERRYIHPCPLCRRLFRRPCEVKQHLLSHGGAKPYQCQDCGKRFGSKSGAGIHVLKQHGKDITVENVIDVCGDPIDAVEVTMNDELDGGRKEEDGAANGRDSCGSDDFEWKMEDDVFSFSDDKESKLTDLDGHEDKGDCPEDGCDAGAALRKLGSPLDVKLEREDDPGGEQDPEESKPKRERRSRGQSYLYEALTKNDAKNLRRRERRKRQKSDTLPKPPKHKCEVCGKMWRTTSEYKSHVATHSDERPYICEICGQAYKHKAALDVHVGMHNGINPFSCPYCNKAFTQKGALQRHLPIHTGEAPYQCELCGKRFVHHTSFNMHTLAHTGQKSYKCKVCGLALLSGSHLKRHSRVHTGERPYQCTTCGKRFAERYNLVAHARVHDPLGSHGRDGHSKKIHRCQLCGASFDRKPKLEDHLALSHNKITDSDDNRKWFSHLLSHELGPAPPEVQGPHAPAGGGGGGPGPLGLLPGPDHHPSSPPPPPPACARARLAPDDLRAQGP
ncbi:zinc finger protein 846-like [Bacillus rossius redtenbacheri]|uniref:zinc finger protein 846-like n=1 Tax=Bacillus rossius redtenbacheri TaxID=93214 RepID=UPI002FDE056A